MKKLLTLALALSLPVAAAQSQPAQPMPLNVGLLPYGTITVADGNYYIPNYQETGIAIYIQSPKSLPVATLDQMMAAQAAWQKYTNLLNQPSPPKPDALPTIPAVNPSTSVASPAPTTAAQPVPAPTANLAASPVAATSTVKPAAVSMQGPSAPKVANFPNAQTAFGKSDKAPVASPSVATAPATAPQAVVSPTSTTLVPEWVRVNFRGRGKITSYSITNNSASQTLSIDPSSVRAYQNGAVVPATLALRDSAGGNGGKLMPNSMLVGTITVVTKSSAPITVTWEAKDSNGRSYPIAYAWMPE